MKRVWEVQRSVLVAAPRQEVWDRVVTEAGINHEMRPWMTMSMPRRAKGLSVETVPVGEFIGRAWLRLFGLIPYDWDRLRLIAVEPPARFHEDSTMISMSRWTHERTLREVGPDQTEVTDRLTLTPRVPLLGPVLRRVINAFFGHRQRRLQKWFSGN